jgi:hypothetical protein
LLRERRAISFFFFGLFMFSSELSQAQRDKREALADTYPA